MTRYDVVIVGTLVLLGTVSACSSSASTDDAASGSTSTDPSDPAGVDPSNPQAQSTQPGSSGPTTVVGIDCGGNTGKKCAEGASCIVDTDCDGACSYQKKCVSAPSCSTHFGGDTCGEGENDSSTAKHESCCRTLKVAGYTDPAHAGKTVYLDKYEITAGRVRAWIEKMAAENGGNPDVKGWIAKNRPQIWDTAWDQFLPTDAENGVVVIARRLLGDPRIEDGTGSNGPGVILPPDSDQPRQMGTNYQFGSAVYVDLHGSNCGTWAGSYGFPTYWYPADILARDNEVARADGNDASGNTIPAKDLLDTKSMNCITNEMLAAFCAWDGGQLATDDVLDFVTQTPDTLGSVSGCGVQYDNHGELLGNNFSHTVETGGRCADVALVNATFDAGDKLPVAGSPLNNHVYAYPDLGQQNFDKAWEIAAPGRVKADVVRINANDEPWMDLHGNLSEAALDMNGATFTGNFSMKYRGIGYGSARSDLNMKPVKGEDKLRLQRPEGKGAFTGGRCMRFK